MVARSPPKQLREMVDPTLLRETVKKVDKCMVRLQELQYTVAGCRKLISPTKQQSLKIKNGNPPRRMSPSGKLPPNTDSDTGSNAEAVIFAVKAG
ncbi:hypothetical protein C2S53_017440 [Perilla frutescens var. hirtella]|uniref:Uncharacterized protein n=1 Tax=Perilla frutescens var. hirtella TaxID=608512 RepID=A0AAD4IRF7_PERFH|nr:hypothetical protein C2S53_017440 [Perilla frutescens var. hirtella]